MAATQHAEAAAVQEQKGGRNLTTSPVANIATPSRGGRGGRGDGNKGERGPSSALQDLMRRRGVDEAWTALEELQAQGTKTDKFTVSRMLMKTVGDGRARLNNVRVYRAISLVERFIEMQPTDVDEVLFNALLDTCGRLKDLPRLEATVQRMRDLKVTPSPVTLGILVKTYGQAGDIQKVLQVWEEMATQRSQANAVTYGCMIDACVKCGRLSTAVEIFMGMRQANKHRNTILYTTLIKGYGLEKDLKSALELFREMPRESVPYNTITYNSIIDACVKCGDLATAEALLEEICQPGHGTVEPDLITFSTVLKGFCHIGDLDRALQLAEAIKQRGLRCDELVYNTLMDGCVKAHDVSAGVGLFEEMVHAGMRPSSITHSILSRLYQHAGYEEDATEAVAQLYQHHGLERPCGGDRMRGAGRRGQRSPGGQGSGPQGSPFGTPMSGYGHRRERSDSCWSNWSETQSSCGGYDVFTDSIASGASTPHGSPMASHPTGAFLPLNALSMPPPLPGMGGSETPNSSCRGATPLSGAFHGSPVGSPCSFPYGGQQQQQQQQQQQCQFYHLPPTVPLTPGSASAQAMPSLPPFPFSQQPVDAQMPQFFMQQAPPPMQGDCSMQMPGQGQGDTPHPFAGQGMACTQMQGQQAFFEGFGQQVGFNGTNPFCL